MKRERIVKFFIGSAGEVERRTNDFLAEPGVVVASKVFIRHWGTDPISLLLMVERDPDDPDVEAHNRGIAERVRRRKLAGAEVEAAKELGLA